MTEDAPGREDVAFREVQRFGKSLWLIVGLAALGAWLAFLLAFFMAGSGGHKRADDLLVLLVLILVGLGLPALFISTKLVVEVKKDALYYRFYPFHLAWHRLAYPEIKSAEARTYRPIKEYGGWGIRYGPKGKAYNVSGDRGVQLELANGKRVLFGSQEADELAAAIREALRAYEGSSGSADQRP